jgi:hypothetical protein
MPRKENNWKYHNKAWHFRFILDLTSADTLTVGSSRLLPLISCGHDGVVTKGGENIRYATGNTFKEDVTPGKPHRKTNNFAGEMFSPGMETPTPGRYTSTLNRVRCISDRVTYKHDSVTSTHGGDR